MSRATRERADVALLFLRVWVGCNFVFAHGLSKITAPREFLAGPGMAKFPMPDVLGWIAMIAEVGGGALLVFGLFTRSASVLLLGTMLGAALVVHSGAPWERKELALLYAVIFVYLIVNGPGRWSLDARRARKKREW